MLQKQAVKHPLINNTLGSRNKKNSAGPGQARTDDFGVNYTGVLAPHSNQLSYRATERMIFDPGQARTDDFGVNYTEVLAPHSNQLSYRV